MEIHLGLRIFIRELDKNVEMSKNEIELRFIIGIIN